MIQTHLADECEHMTGDVTLGEASTSVSKQILPFALENFVFCTIRKGRIVLDDEVLC